MPRPSNSHVSQWAQMSIIGRQTTWCSFCFCISSSFLQPQTRMELKFRHGRQEPQQGQSPAYALELLELWWPWLLLVSKGEASTQVLVRKPDSKFAGRFLYVQQVIFNLASNKKTFLLVNTHTHTHTHPRTHTCVHTHMHAHTHTRTPTHTHIHTYKHIHIELRAQADWSAPTFEAAQSPRWGTRCSFGLVNSAGAAMQHLDQRSASELDLPIARCPQSEQQRTWLVFAEQIEIFQVKAWLATFRARNANLKLLDDRRKKIKENSPIDLRKTFTSTFVESIVDLLSLNCCRSLSKSVLFGFFKFVPSWQKLSSIHDLPFSTKPCWIKLFSGPLEASVGWACGWLVLAVFFGHG